MKHVKAKLSIFMTIKNIFFSKREIKKIIKKEKKKILYRIKNSDFKNQGRTVLVNLGYHSNTSISQQ